jgi:hypothetical protein
VGFIDYRQCSLQAALENQKKELIASLQKKASFLFEARSQFTIFFGLLYLGWESNPHDIAITGF